MYAFLLLLGLLLASPQVVFGATWHNCSNAADGVSSIDVGVPACANPVTGDATTSLLNVTNCGTWTIVFDEDNAASAIDTGTLSVYNCTTPVASLNTCKLVGGVVLTGTPPNNEHYGAGGGWIYAIGAAFNGKTMNALAVCQR